MKRRQAVEPAIGHLKSDHRLERCWLKGTLDDAPHAIGCAAGDNLRWLLRAIVRLGIRPVFSCPLQITLWAVRPKTGMYGTRDWRFIDAVHLNPDTPQSKEPEAAKKAA